MKHLLFILTLGFIALICVSSTAQAQDALSPQNYKKFKPVYNPQAAKDITSNILPILKNEVLKSTPNGTISNEIIEKIYDQCLSKVPPHFTPDAHQYYCSCTAAGTSAAIKTDELKELQSKKNWKLGNKTFEKYVHEVVMPCIDIPIDDMEYMSCILNRSHDWRVDRIPQYCKCISHAAKNHVIEMGETEMMVEWGNPLKNYMSPLDALWYSDTYNRYKRQYSEQCLGSYMTKDPLGRN
ncbi:MAG: hypothetical protein KDJ26_03835 [Alphaproteobacteria bacterium]|nr:hypothetical protein [Alphaproteobacteria bacterium]MCB1551114.1 hypothetical protein [Alphaproteobacteria bacterium]MCB9985019.1 hypothetical protein [Micavibrio sp.]HRK97409.1 hypothetical protein [Alphaproteobacteria bacterium]